MEKKDNPFLNPDWLNMQQQYIDALSALTPGQKPSETAGGNQTAWNAALDYWWKSIEKSLPGENRPVFDSVLQQSRTFYSIADQFAEMIKDVSSVPAESDDWQSVMANHLGKMKAQFDVPHSTNSGHKEKPAFTSLLPWESWKQTMTAMAIMPDEVLKKFDPAGINSISDKLFSIPGIGPTREFQDRVRKAIELWNEYQGKCDEYRTAFADLSKLALDRLEEKIIERANSDRKITSIRQIYDLWVDANEEIFATFAFNEDYSRLYGDLVNSLMRFRQQGNEVLDEILSIMSMPTLRGVNTVHKRQHKMGNELRTSMEMQQRVAADLHLLQVELRKMQSQVFKNGPAKGVTKPKTTRRKKKDVT